jgi:hypothetical protein
MEGSLTQKFTAISVRQVSQIPEDKLALVASFGPNGKEEFFVHYVRGVVVQTSRQTKTEFGKSYRLCIFPGWRYQWVNEGNIRSRKINKYGEIHNVNESKLAA